MKWSAILIPTGQKAFHCIGINLVGSLAETKEGYKYLVTAVCAFTKCMKSEPLKDKSAKEVAKFLHRLICRL